MAEMDERVLVGKLCNHIYMGVLKKRRASDGGADETEAQKDAPYDPTSDCPIRYNYQPTPIDKSLSATPLNVSEASEVSEFSEADPRQVCLSVVLKLCHADHSEKFAFSPLYSICT